MAMIVSGWIRSLASLNFGIARNLSHFGVQIRGTWRDANRLLEDRRRVDVKLDVSWMNHIIVWRLELIVFITRSLV